MADNSRLSFKFSFYKRLHLSVIFFAVCCVLSAVTYFGVEIYKDRKAKAEIQENTPQLALDSWQKDLSAFYEKRGIYPLNLRDLEIYIWNTGDKLKPSRLKNGENYYLLNNYLYLYKSDGKIVSLWAIPQGKLKNDSSTNYMLLTPKAYHLWKGPALSDEDIDRIPERVIPLDIDMAKLGMTKQSSETSQSQTDSKNSIFKPFWKK